MPALDQIKNRIASQLLHDVSSRYEIFPRQLQRVKGPKNSVSVFSSDYASSVDMQINSVNNELTKIGFTKGQLWMFLLHDAGVTQSTRVQDNYNVKKGSHVTVLALAFWLFSFCLPFLF